MNIAELGIRVDSTEAAKAATDLDKMALSGERAEQSAVGLMDEMKALEKSLATGARTTQELARQREALTRLTKAGAYGEAEFGRISATLDKQQVALVKSTLNEQKALNSLLGAIDPARAALGKLDRQVEDLGKHFDAGRLSQSEYADALSKLEAQYSLTAGGASQLDLSTAGAKESLVELGKAAVAGDFDRAGLAFARLASATGNSVLGLARLAAPAALAGAAIGTLAYGYFKGSKEADQYNESLILTGSYAGKTAGQLADMARQVAATNGTVGEAAASLAKLASTGFVAGESFGAIATAAAAMEDATGKSVDATIAEFVKIAKDPVVAAKELNQQYHFLTAEVYSQIVALKQQGDTIGAAKLLTDTYAETIGKRSGEITRRLGLVERAWKGVKDASKGALDATLEFGREKTLTDKIRDLEEKLASPSAYSALPVLGADNPDLMAQGGTRSEDEASLRALKQTLDLQGRLDAYQKQQQEHNEKAIEAQDYLNARLLRARSNAKKLQDELAEIDKMAAAAAYKGKEYSNEEIATLKAAATERYKDPKTSSSAPDLSAFNNGKNQLAAALGYYKNIEKELDASQKAGIISQESYHAQRIALIQQQAAEVENAYQVEIAALEKAKSKKGVTTEQVIQLDQKIADARAAMVKAQRDAESQQQVLATEEKARLTKQKAAIDGYTEALARQNAALRLAGERAAVGVGQGTRQNALNNELNGIADRASQQRLDLERDKADAARKMDAEEYLAKLAAINQSEINLKETALKNYQEMAIAQGDWQKGATSAWANYLDSARDVAGQTRNLFTNAFSSMEDAIVRFAMTGKLSFADFAKSILADMARIAARQAVLQMLGALVGGFMGGGPKSPGSTPPSPGPELLPQAKGGAWESGVQLFAKGGAFSNGVINTPTAFGMSGGKTGVMGEDGPEAIMPLTRAVDGSLGVRALGAGAAVGNVYSFPINVSIDASGNNTATGGNPDAGAELGKGIQDAAKAEAEAAIRKGLQPGGRIWMAIKGRG